MFYSTAEIALNMPITVAIFEARMTLHKGHLFLPHEQPQSPNTIFEEEKENLKKKKK